VVTTTIDKLLVTEGVDNAVGFAGYSALTSSTGPNVATIFASLAPYDERKAKGISFEQLLAQLRADMATIDNASIRVVNPPPVRGLGYAGGFRMMLQDQNGRGLDTLAAAGEELAGTANQTPGLSRVFMLFDTRTPQLYLDVDRVRAEQLGVPVENVFEALEVYFGSAFINDFNFLGRTFQVTAQADSEFRRSPRDLLNLRTRNRAGDPVPLGSIAASREPGSKCFCKSATSSRVCSGCRHLTVWITLRSAFINAPTNFSLATSMPNTTRSLSAYSPISCQFTLLTSVIRYLCLPMGTPPTSWCDVLCFYRSIFPPGFSRVPIFFLYS